MNHWVKAVGIPRGEGWDLMLRQGKEPCAAASAVAVTGVRRPVDCWGKRRGPRAGGPLRMDVLTFLCHTDLSVGFKYSSVFSPLDEVLLDSRICHVSRVGKMGSCVA